MATVSEDDDDDDDDDDELVIERLNGVLQKTTAGMLCKRKLAVKSVYLRTMLRKSAANNGPLVCGNVNEVKTSTSRESGYSLRAKRLILADIGNQTNSILLHMKSPAKVETTVLSK
jgi:hypothetical protein